MQNFCKKFREYLYWLAVGCFLAFSSACSDTESSEVELKPDHDINYQLFPNDKAANDSASSNLAHGIGLVVHPHAEYELSFDIDENYDEPTLQLYRVVPGSNGRYGFVQVRSLKPRIENGRYVYEFLCEEKEMHYWATTLLLDDTFYPGKTKHARLTGRGIYSDTLSINLVLVGNVASEFKDFTLDDLRKELLSAYRKVYTSIHIDTLYVHYANEHPELGKKYRANEPWYAGYSSSDIMLSELGGWPGFDKALDLVLVHYINKAGIMGYSDLFSGNLGSGEGSTIILGAFVRDQASTEQALTLNDIVETALHETGHFFGLRHTTTTLADIQHIIDGMDIGDYSNLEDGIEDTPYCKALQRSGLVKSQPAIESDVHKRDFLWSVPLGRSTSFTTESCPDATNYMFPVTVSAGPLSFTKQQLEIIRANLMIVPH